MPVKMNINETIDRLLRRPESFGQSFWSVRRACLFIESLRINDNARLEEVKSIAGRHIGVRLVRDYFPSRDFSYPKEAVIYYLRQVKRSADFDFFSDGAFWEY